MCFNKCENGGMTIVNEEDVCGCKCPTGLKGDDCSQLDTSLYVHIFLLFLPLEISKKKLDIHSGASNLL